MRQSSQKYRQGVFEGMSNMSYSLHSVQLRAFYTYIHANLNGLSVDHLSLLCPLLLAYYY